MPCPEPAGYSASSPSLIVDNAVATLDFLQTVFGGALMRRFDDEQGRVRHSEVRIDECVLMVTDAFPGWPARPAQVHVYVADVDDVYARALAAGAESVQAPVRKDDEDKRGGVKDVGGTTCGSRHASRRQVGGHSDGAVSNRPAFHRRAVSTTRRTA